MRDIRDLTLTDLQDWCAHKQIPAYRAKQIFDWIYGQKAEAIDAFANVPLAVREALKADFVLQIAQVKTLQRSKDGTVKFLWELVDGQTIESVLIPTTKRYTLCISSQVGCALACRFCASGLAGLKRQLTTAEIVGQVVDVLRLEKLERIHNLVFMGIGEPLHNFKAVTQAIDIFNEAHGLNIGARKMTVSTVGLVPEIKRFADYPKQVELAVSLHAPNDKLRSELMPINKKYPLSVLLPTCWDYSHQTKRQITFEYVMLNQVNDSPELAHELADLLQGHLAKVNLIPFNSNTESGFACSSPERMERFRKILESRKVLATVRTPRGRDIDAACGQLRHLKRDKGL